MLQKSLFLLLFVMGLAVAGSADLQRLLNSVHGLTVKKLPAEKSFSASFQIFIEQPLDHQDPEGAHFKQQIILSHRSFSAPTVLVTEGYGIYDNHTRELSQLLQANEIRVEHRFFGRSKPDSMDWDNLTIAQEAADYHRIQQIFKTIYKGKWISTGWSKGGQTAVFYRFFYPQDVDATLAYDSPFNLQREDTRIDSFFNHVGTAFCRQKIKAFQKMALQRKADLLPLFQKYALREKYQFSIGLQAALEYAILEYPFSFWQYHKLNCDSIPTNSAFPRAIFNHLKLVVALSSYSDTALNSPAMYQFFTELGYYGYVTDGLEPWLSGAYGYSNALFAPRNAVLKYRPQRMQKIIRWLKENASKIAFIYGSNDPWSASAIDFPGRKDLLKQTLGGGNHFTFIRTLPQMEQKRIIGALKQWLYLEERSKTNDGD